MYLVRLRRLLFSIKALFSFCLGKIWTALGN